MAKENKERYNFIRKGSVTAIPNDDELKDLFALANRTPFDDRVNHDAEISDINYTLVKAYLKENGDFKTSINNGIVYSTCIAIIAPLFIEFLANYISDNHQKKKEEYSTYKAWSMAICIAALICLFLFYGTAARNSFVLQIICIIAIFIISFYTYLVTKMAIHSTLLEDYKDKPYYEIEKEVLKDTEEKSKELTSTRTDTGAEVKL